MNTLVIAEHDNHQLRPSTLNTITAALAFNQPIDVLVAGAQCQAVAEQLTAIAGVREILLADHASYQHALAENLAQLVLDILSKADYTHVLAPATTFGKNFMPRVAAVKNVSQISDITAVVNANTYQRPIYAGNAIATVRSSDSLQIITVRSTAFASAGEGGEQATVRAVDFVVDAPLSEFVSEELHQSDRPELTSANIVISGGRGLQNKENFERLTKIADRLGAAIGASRAAVDSGMAPNDFQVGQTGQVVAPNVYFAVGISGAIQHLAGMKDSKIIVAINKDPDAPIFQIADYGVVADLQEVLPQWEQALSDKGF